jgi:hypothetical protein
LGVGGFERGREVVEVEVHDQCKSAKDIDGEVVTFLVEGVHECFEAGQISVSGTEGVVEAAMLVTLGLVRDGKERHRKGAHFFVVGAAVGFCAVGCVTLIYFCGGKGLL